MATLATVDDVPPLSSLPQTVRKKLLAHEQLDLAQQQLLGCIKALTKSSSIFTKAALFWHQLLWWQKITTGSMLCLPLLVGLISQVTLVALLGLSLVFFSSLSLFLVDNHVKHHQLLTEEIEATVLGLIKLLATMIENLELLNTQLGEELQVIKDNNKTLTKKCQELQEETLRLRNSNHSLDENQKELLTVQKTLKTTIITIDSTVNEQTLLLQKSQALLEETTKAYQANQQQLTETIVELGEVKKTLSSEVDKAQGVTKTLKNTLQVLSKEMIGNQQSREQFLSKLDALINNQEVQFDTIIKSLAASGKQLSETAEEIKADSLRFHRLLNQQEHHINRLAQIEAPPTRNTAKEMHKARQQHGFYAPEPSVTSILSAANTPIVVMG